MAMASKAASDNPWNLSRDSRSSSSIILRSVISLVMLMKPRSFPSAFLRREALASPEKREPSFFSRVYSSVMAGPVSGFVRIERKALCLSSGAMKSKTLFPTTSSAEW